MPIGAFTGQFDLPLLLVIVFFLFFLCLVYYLHQEDKREGYPLVSHRTKKTNGRVQVQGFPALPKPKVFLQPHGRPPVYAPRKEDLPPIEATNVGNPTGMPIGPIGDPLLSGTGAASWVEKVDEPDISHDGKPIFQPLRADPAFHVMKGDPDPRGFVVLGLDKQVAGRVVDIWFDKAEHHARFFEVEVDGEIARADERKIESVVVHDMIVDTDVGPVEVLEYDIVTRDTHANANGGTGGVRTVLLPTEFCSVNGRKRTVRSGAITAAQFAKVPGRRAADTVTAREEQRIRGYFGGGLLWGTDLRRGPLL